jgi:hypothetical protein
VALLLIGLTQISFAKNWFDRLGRYVSAPITSMLNYRGKEDLKAHKVHKKGSSWNL